MRHHKHTDNPNHLLAGFRARLKEHSTPMNRFADWMTESFGTPAFLIGNTIFFILWILLNSGSLGEGLMFDPFPYNFLTMTVSLEAIFLAIIVLVSQNRAAKIGDMREEMDFEINLRAEAEVTKILIMLDEIQDHLGIENSQDVELNEMERKLDILQIKKEIEEANQD